MNYAITAGRRQFLPALSRQPAITSDSIIPRQILSSKLGAEKKRCGGLPSSSLGIGKGNNRHGASC